MQNNWTSVKEDKTETIHKFMKMKDWDMKQYTRLKMLLPITRIKTYDWNPKMKNIIEWHKRVVNGRTALE